MIQNFSLCFSSVSACLCVALRALAWVVGVARGLCLKTVDVAALELMLLLPCWRRPSSACPPAGLCLFAGGCFGRFSSRLESVPRSVVGGSSVLCFSAFHSRRRLRHPSSSSSSLCCSFLLSVVITHCWLCRQRRCLLCAGRFTGTWLVGTRYCEPNTHR